MPRRPVFLLLHLSSLFSLTASKRSPVECLKWSCQTPYWCLSLIFKVLGESKHLECTSARQITLWHAKDSTIPRHWLTKKVCDWTCVFGGTLQWSVSSATIQSPKRKSQVREHDRWQITIFFPLAD